MNKGTIRYGTIEGTSSRSRTIQGDTVEAGEEGAHTYLRARSNPTRGGSVYGTITEEWRVLTSKVLEMHLETVERLEKP